MLTVRNEPVTPTADNSLFIIDNGIRKLRGGGAGGVIQGTYLKHPSKRSKGLDNTPFKSLTVEGLRDTKLVCFISFHEKSS